MDKRLLNRLQLIICTVFICISSCGNDGGSINREISINECKLCGEWQSINGVTTLTIFPNHAKILISFGDNKCQGNYKKLNIYGEKNGEIHFISGYIYCDNGQSKKIDKLIVKYKIGDYTLTLNDSDENETIYTRNLTKIPDGSNILSGKWVNYKPNYVLNKNIENFEILFTQNKVLQNTESYDVEKYIAEHNRVLVLLKNKELLIFEIIDENKIKYKISQNSTIIMVRSID